MRVGGKPVLDWSGVRQYVKDVRLCFQLGREGSLLCASKLDSAMLPTCRDRSWESKSFDDLLMLKP